MNKKEWLGNLRVRRMRLVTYVSPKAIVDGLMATGHSLSGDSDRPRVLVDFHVESWSGQPKNKHPYRS